MKGIPMAIELSTKRMILSQPRHWTAVKVAEECGVTESTVRRVWKQVKLNQTINRGGSKASKQYYRAYVCPKCKAAVGQNCMMEVGCFGRCHQARLDLVPVGTRLSGYPSHLRQ